MQHDGPDAREAQQREEVVECDQVGGGVPGVCEVAQRARKRGEIGGLRPVRGRWRMVLTREVQGFEAGQERQEEDYLLDFRDAWVAEREVGSRGCEGGEVTDVVAYVAAVPGDGEVAGVRAEWFTGWGEEGAEIVVE